MSKKDEDLFLREMAGVTPLAPDDRVVLPVLPRPDIAAEERRRAALGTGPEELLTLPERVPEVGPMDIVGAKKNGVQEGVYRKLRLGKYDPGAYLDLHRVKLRDARRLVQGFLVDAVRRNVRTVLITHGKGMHSPVPGVLKSYVMFWMEECDLVLAWHSAQPRHGGAGATYVLVRKSGEARQRTRESYSG